MLTFTVAMQILSSVTLGLFSLLDSYTDVDYIEDE